MKTKILVVLSVLVAVFVIGSLVDYVYAYDGANCRSRWGEAIGIGCQVPAALITVADVTTHEVAAVSDGIVCRSRWGEPVGTGCRVPMKIVTVSKEGPQETPAAYKVPAYRTRWGEPIGIGYR
ncbi:MAG: hypothetical protein AB1499_11250 [Nitrospirota bacterium]